MTHLLRRLYYLMNRRRLDQELVNDMEFHREMAARADGRRLGSTLRLREEARDAWGWTWIERLSQDVRYAVRMLRKSPGFTLAAVLTLAIGIGVNIAAFGFFDLLVLRPLPVREPATLLRFHRRSPQRFAFVLPYPEAAFFREHTRTLTAVLALNSTKLVADGEEKQVTAHFVTSNFFSELGAVAGLGRIFEPVANEASREPMVVLSEGFWRRHFGGDPMAIGKKIRLNNKPATVIGIVPTRVSGLSLDSPDLWAPISQQPYFASGSRLLTDFSEESSGVMMWGRLRPGLSPKIAEAELTSLAAELRRQRPLDVWEKESLPSEPGGYAKSLMIGGRRGSGSENQDEVYPIAAVVGALCLLILAVACANLGSLLLARGVAREREIAIRISIGAGSGRLIRQLFTESLVLALSGSVVGIALGYSVLRNLMALTGAPGWLDPAPDWQVIAFAAAMGLVAAIFFGLAPALQMARQRPRGNRMREVLVAAQVAASCVLLIVAGLLVRAFSHAASADPGFEYQHVVSIDPGLNNHGYDTGKAQTYLNSLESRLRALPGVRSVSLALSPPLGNRHEGARVDLAGRSIDVQINRVDPQFFDTMKIPLLRGRNLHAGDNQSIIISDSLARRWPTGDPLGKKFSMGSDFTVVGVAGSARTLALENSDGVEVYLLIQPSDLPAMAMLARTAGSPEAFARSATTIMRGIDPNVLPNLQLLTSLFRESLQGVRYGAFTVSLMGLVALLIACLGIVGLVAFAVAQRTKEIGIRIALGAKSADVLSSILRRFLGPVLLGLIVGVAGASALSQILRRVLYGVSSLDPGTYVAVVMLFAVTAAAAAFVPARRALSIDPIRALRYD